MLMIFRDTTGRIRDSSSSELPREVIWIDLLSPTDEETAFVEFGRMSVSRQSKR